MQAQHLPHAAAAAAAAASLVPSISMPPYPSSLAGSANVSVSGAASLLGLAAAAGAPSSLITPSSSHFHAIKDEKGSSLTVHCFDISACLSSHSAAVFDIKEILQTFNSKTFYHTLIVCSHYVIKVDSE